MHLSDKNLLRAFVRAPSAQQFEPIVDRYLPFVLAAARRQSLNEADAVDVTRAVFVAFARRSRQLPRKAVLVEWFFQAARAAAARQKRTRTKTVAPPIIPGASLPKPGTAAAEQDGDTRARISPLLDPVLARLSAKYRAPLLLRVLLNWDVAQAAEALRLRPKRLEKRSAKGFSKLSRLLRKKGLLIDDTPLRTALVAGGCAATVPSDLKAELLDLAEDAFRSPPKLALARGTLRALTWARWKRFLKFAGATSGALALFLGATAFSGWYLWTSGRLLPWLIEFGARQQLKEIPELAEPARPWPSETGRVLVGASSLKTAEELYRTTNIWPAHLRFTPEQWAGLSPRRVPPVPNMMQPDGTILLRNPNAQRSGVAGAVGFDFEWTQADLEFGGATFTNVAARYRGNGTYMSSLFGQKQSYKADLNKHTKGQEVAGVRTLNLLNLVEDRSYMSDALAYEVFRAAGVPAARTAYAWLTVTVTGQFERKPLGLYLMVENMDGDFAKRRFGSKATPIFKPVTPDLFKYLGEDWGKYATIYDLKTKATPQQIRRVVDFSKLLTHASDAEFAEKAGEFLDLDEFARFMAALVLVANYDSFLTYGQNYYMYLDPQTDKFGFMPWDMDQAWGSFNQFGTAAARERASIWQPWAIRNRLLERLMQVEAFRSRYRSSLEELLATTFVPERLWARIDEIASLIRDPIAAESAFRLRLFDQATSTNWLAGPRDGGGDGPKRPVHQLKRFIVNRAKSVRDQLDGRSRGIVLESSVNSGQ